MPAAAVIPAPIAYIKVVAVKKLVVGFLVGANGARRAPASPAIRLLNQYGILLLTGGSDNLP